MKSEMYKPLETFEPLQRPRALNDMAYENMKKGILTGKLATGQIYSELELAREFGVSRTPVREALLKLSAENLIVFHPRKGISVTFFSEEDVENLFDLRQTIEEAAISNIIGKLGKSQMQAIEELIKQQEKCIKKYDEDVFLACDRNFHLLMIEATNNRFMIQS